MVAARILALDNYDSFTFTLVDYLRTLGSEVTVCRNDAISARDALAGPFDGFVISPGPGRPEDAGASVELARACIEPGRPLIGVCLGHQAIALLVAIDYARAADARQIANVRHDSPAVRAPPFAFQCNPLSPRSRSNPWSLR